MMVVAKAVPGCAAALLLPLLDLSVLQGFSMLWHCSESSYGNSMQVSGWAAWTDALLNMIRWGKTLEASKWHFMLEDSCSLLL